MDKKILNSIFKKKENLLIIIAMVLLEIIILLGAWQNIKPHIKKQPCVVCGSAKTKVHITLHEYKTGMLQDKAIYYCSKHIKNAPRIIHKLPSKNDSILKRFHMILVSGIILLILLIYAVAIFEVNFAFLIIAPIIQLVTFFLFGIVSNFSISIIVGSIIIIPVFLFYFWKKSLYEN